MAAATQAWRWPVTALPQVRLAGVFPLDDRGFRYRYGPAPHHALHLHEYAGVIRLDGRDHALEPGTVTLSPAHGWSSYDLTGAGRHWCVHFHAASAPRGALAAALPLVLPLGERQSEASARLALIVRHHAAAQRRGRDGQLAAAAAAAALLDLILWLATLRLRPAAAATIDPVDRLLDFINRRLDRPLAVPDLARGVGVSQNYLARRFRQRTGLTIPGYILRRRVEQARLLLSTTAMPVKLIGARVGMPDPQHFNKQFRRFVGVSPTAARARG